MHDILLVEAPFQAGIEADEDRQDQENQGRRHTGNGEIACTDDEADGRNSPEAGSRRQAPDAAGLLIGQDRTGTDETDTGYDLGRNPFGVGIVVAEGEIVIHGDVDGYNHAQAGTDADQGMRPKAGRLALGLPFITDESAQDKGYNQADDAGFLRNHNTLNFFQNIYYIR